MSSKKIVGFIAGIVLFGLALAPVAQAGEYEDLLAQIQKLTEELNRLKAELAKYQAPAGGYEGIPQGFKFEKYLKQGSRGDEVRYLQIILAKEVGADLVGPIDGIFGPKTKSAVIAFQEKYAADILTPWGLTKGTGFVGKTTIAKLNALLTAPTPPPAEEEEVPEEAPEVKGLEVSLAEDSPSARNLPCNASGVLYSKVVLKAGEDVKITSITVKREGLGEADDFSRVALFVGSERISSAKTINAETNEAVFNLRNPLEIGKGEEKVVEIRATMAGTSAGCGNADVGNASKLGISAISSNASSLSGVPVYGHLQEIISYKTGVLTVTGQTVPGSTEIGKDNVKLAEFKLSASSKEDIVVKAIILKEIETADEEDIGNLSLSLGGTTLASGVSVVDKYALFDFSGNPITIEKDQSEILTVRGDIKSGVNEKVEFILEEDLDLLALGKTSNAGVEITNNFTSGTAVSITGGEITLDFDGPSATEVVPDQSNVILANLKMTTVNEDVEIDSLKVQILLNNATTTAAENVELYDPATGVIYDYSSFNSSTGKYTFEDLYLSKGVTRTLQIRMDIPQTGSGASDGDYWQAKLYASDVSATGVVSDKSITNITPSSLTSNKMTVRTSALTITSEELNPGSATVGEKGVLLFRGKLKTSVASKVTISRMKFEASSSGYFDKDNVETAYLYVGGALAQKITSVSDGVADFDAMSVEIPAKSELVYEVKVDIKSTLDATNKTLGLKLTLVSAKDKDNNDVTAKDVGGNAISSTNPLTTNRVVGLKSKGVLTITVDTSGLKDRYVLAGESTEFLMALELKALYEEIKIKDLTLTNANNTSYDSVEVVELYKSDKTTLVASKEMVGDKVTFSDLNYLLSPGTDYLYIKAKTKNISAASTGTADSGDQIKLKIASASDVVAEGVASGEPITPTVDTSFGTEAIVVAGRINAVANAMTSTSLAAGPDQILFKFTVSVDDNSYNTTRSDTAANAGNPLKVALKSLAVKVYNYCDASGNCTLGAKNSTTTFVLYNADDPSTTISAVSDPIDSSFSVKFSNLFSIDNEIEAASSHTYVFVGTVVRAGDNDYVKVTIPNLNGSSGTLGTNYFLSWYDGDLDGDGTYGSSGTAMGQAYSETERFDLRLDYTKVEGNTLQ